MKDSKWASEQDWSRPVVKKPPIPGGAEAALRQWRESLERTPAKKELREIELKMEREKWMNSND